MTADDKLELIESSDRVLVIGMWIVEELTSAVKRKLVTVPPPIVTRVYNEVSNGMLGFNQALKLDKVQLPFCFSQMTSILTVAWMVTMPLGMVWFTGSAHIA